MIDLTNFSISDPIKDGELFTFMITTEKKETHILV